MMVRKREDQADVLIEAVQNHTPDVIIVDEIGTRKEVEAAKTIAQRGVQLVATAHGNTLGDLLRNPTLKDLVAGTTSVTLGDAAAKTNNSGRKTVTERMGSATSNTLVELRSKQEWCLHLDVERSVDAMLRDGLSGDGSCSEEDSCHQQSASSRAAITQVRTIDGNGRVLVKFESPVAAKQALSAAVVVDKLADRASVTESTASRDLHSNQGVAGEKTTGQQNWGGHGFTGGWLVDLVHTAVHKAIVSAAEQLRK